MGRSGEFLGSPGRDSAVIQTHSCSGCQCSLQSIRAVILALVRARRLMKIFPFGRTDRQAKLRLFLDCVTGSDGAPAAAGPASPLCLGPESSEERGELLSGRILISGGKQWRCSHKLRKLAFG